MRPGSRSNSGALLLGTTLTPELLTVLLQGAKIGKSTATAIGGAGQYRVVLICY